jgi:hypothetical protein
MTKPEINLRATALGIATRNCPPNREPWRHEQIVYAVFSDAFDNWSHFARCVDRKLTGGKQVNNPQGSRDVADGGRPDAEEARDAGDSF